MWGLKISIVKLRYLLNFYLIVVYSPGVFHKGAWSDDYAALLEPNSVGMHALRDSRPVYGATINLFYGLFSTVEGLSFIRLFGLLGLVLLCNELCLRFEKLPNGISLMIFTTFALTLPSFQFSAHWAIAYAMSWSGYMALYGFRLFLDTKLNFRLLGLLFLILSLLTYPLVTFILFSVVFIEGLLFKETVSQLLKRLLKPFLFMSLGIPISYFVSSIFMYSQNVSPNSRVSLVSIEQVPEKIIWFVTRPWALSFRPFLINSPSVSEAVIWVILGCLLILSLLISYYKSLSTALRVFCLFCFVLTLSILPLLFTSQNQIDVRFLGSNTFLVLIVVLFLSFNCLSSTCFERPKRSLVYTGALVLIFFGFWSVNDRYSHFIKPIFQENLSFISSELEGCDYTSKTLRIEVIQRGLPWGVRPLLGFYSQESDFESEWVPLAAVTAYAKSNRIEAEEVVLLPSIEGSKGGCQIFLDNYGRNL